jgi:hypothetical protein
MTAADRNSQIRRKLDHRLTAGVPTKDDGTPAPSGYMFCVRCWSLMRNQRAGTHRQFRCRGVNAMNAAADMPSASLAGPGCERIICKPPRVSAPRAKRTVDPLQVYRRRRDDAERDLRRWERRLTIALGKMKEKRRAYAGAERAMAEQMAAMETRVAGPGKTRRIIVSDAEGGDV